MAKVAFLGLGAMGQRMAARLLAAGHTVTVWNRSAAAATALQSQGAVAASTPRAAALDADAVFSMVFDDAASRRVWLDAETGAAAGLAAHAVAVECSTLSPAWVAELGHALQRQGAALLDAPVAGSRPQAQAGQLIFMVGGAPEALATAQPLLLAMGSAVHHVGPAGSGAWLKLAVNTLLGTQVAILAEQLALLGRAGLDLPLALQALRAMPVTSPSTAAAGALMLAQDYTPQAPIDLIGKDLRYALDSARTLGLDLVLTAAVRERFAAASAAGHGGEHLVALAKLYPHASQSAARQAHASAH